MNLPRMRLADCCRESALRWVRSCAVSLLALALSPFVLADGSGPIDPFPITGAYSAFHREDRDHISIIEIAGNYNKDLSAGIPNVEPRAVIAREFFRKHPDQYDFIVAFSDFEFETGDAMAFHWAVQNKVQGIGIRPFDITSLFGSSGKLQGFIDMAALTRYKTDPLNPEFETVLGVMAHEMLHQWGVHVRFRQPDGSLSDALIGKDDAHWSYLLDSKGSVEYGADWKDNGDGTFTAVTTRKFYSPLDLYLMGVYKPEEVPPFFLIDNPQIDKTKLPEQNVTITGVKRTVTINDIIAAEGPRVPAAGQAQKDFRVAFVYLVGPDQQVSDEKIAALNNIRNAFMTRFAIVTAGRAVASIYPEALPTVTSGAPVPVSGSDPRTTPANLEDAMAWLRSRQRAEGFFSDKDTTAVRDTTVAVGTLASLDAGFNGTSAALQWLSQNPGANTDYLARQARLLTDLTRDASTTRAQLTALQNSDGGWGIAAGYQSDPLDTALAILALSGSGSAQTALDKAVQYLIAKQNADGGWSSSPSSPSRATVTTTVLRALQGMGRHATVAPNAIAWLKTKQNPDGGFGDSPSTVHDTAHALQSFMALDAIGQIRADGAAGYLLSRQTASGSWDGSVYATASAVSALKRFSFPNWVATSASAAPTSPRDGERVKLTIAVKNDANAFAPAGVLRVYDGDPTKGGTAIGPDLAIPTLAPGAGVTFNPYWDSFGKAGTHTLVAVVDPDNLQTEMSKRDNSVSVNVAVQPAPAGVDLTFGSPEISVTPAQPNRLPTTLGILVNVRNLGLTDARNVRVRLWAGQPGKGTLVGESTLDVLNRSSVVANFSYVLTQPAGATFTAQIDPDNQIVEDNKTNNTTSLNVSTLPSVDLVVTSGDISVDKSPALVGNDVSFKVKLRNEGTVDAPAAQVRYLVTDGNTTKELRTNTVQLNAGQSTEQTITWRVDLSGHLTFTTQIDPSGLVPELDKSNNVATLTLNSGSASGPNLAVSYQDFTFAPSPGREGYQVVLSAVVRNTGAEAVNNAEVGFYNGDPAQGGVQLGVMQVIPTLAPGASATVSVVWPSLPDSADKLLFVVADPANKISEFSEDDNVAFNVLPVLSLPDLAISSGDIQLTPAFPKTGESVVLTARVSNLGAQEATNIVVRAYDGDPAAGGTQIGTDRTISRIDGFASGVATFNWTSSATTTSRPIFVQVDPLNAILERTKSNNVAYRDVSVQDSSLYVTNKYFSPNGDGVKDTTQLFFRLQSAATVIVQVVNKRDQIVRSFSGPTLANVSGGNAEWNGLDDLGRVVPDGTYRLRVVGNVGANLGETTVVVDTNRSSLLESEGTKYASFTNLTCEAKDTTYFTLTNDDSKAFFTSYEWDPNANANSTNIYRMEGDGTDIRTIVPGSFFDLGRTWATDMSAAANGSRVSFIRAGSQPQDLLWVVDGDGRNLKRVEPPATIKWGGETWMSPDGSTIYSVSQGDEVATGSLFAIPVADPTQARVIFQSTQASFLSGGIRFSPDGKKVALQSTNYSDYGHVLWIIDLGSGSKVAPFGESERGSYDYAWSPNGERLAVARWVRGPDGGRFNLVPKVFFVDKDGNQRNAIDVPLNVSADVTQWIEELAWSDSSTEIAFKAYTSDDFEDATAEVHRGGIFVANITTGTIEKAATFVPRLENGDGCGECHSYHISTWDGKKWVERGVLHYDLHYQEKELDLSSYLPDPDSEYKVRIRQQGMEAAHVDSAALRAGKIRVLPTSAVHLGTNKDVLAEVIYPDNEVLDLHEAEMIVRWQNVPPGRISLLLKAREEILSNRNAMPFSYPAEAQQTYKYLVSGERPMAVDGEQTVQDGLGEPLFNVHSRPDTGHPAADVYGYVQNDHQYLYAALDFTVDNTRDGDKDWAALRIKTKEGWKEFRVTESDKRYGIAGFTHTGKVHHTHKYYEFKVPLSEIGASEGQMLDIAFQAYGTAAIFPGGVDESIHPWGYLFWVPGERSLLYQYNEVTNAIFLDDGYRRKRVFADWDWDFYELRFSPTGRQMLFQSGRDAFNPTSVCYRQGYQDQFSFRTLLNLTADLRAIRSAKAGGVQLKGTAADLNFSSYKIEYASVNTPDNWQPITPSSGQPVVDDLFTTWVPPGPGNYFVRLSVEDLAGNVRRTIKRVWWADTPSITDLYRTPMHVSPNGDGVNDNAIIHYRVLEPVHLTFEFFNEKNVRVRTITRDHTLIGAEINLNWDGRDDNGLPVADGKYRMTVENYEFFFIVDNTPPAANLTVREAYQSVQDPQSKIDYVAVNPGIEWKAADAHLDQLTLETGIGADPAEWNAQPNNCLAPEKGCDTSLLLQEFTNHVFRLNATDLAGNRTVVQTPLPAEQLIVFGFGNHLVAPCGQPGNSVLNCNSEAPEYALLNPVAYAPISSPDPNTIPHVISLKTVRFKVAETIRQSLAQISVQFRLATQETWSEGPVKEMFSPLPNTGPTDRLSEAVSLPDHTMSVTWDMAGVQGGAEYVVRLHTIDSAGTSYFSNALRFKTDGMTFYGLVDSPAAQEKVAPLLKLNPPQADERILWGEQFIGEPLESVRLLVRSTDDPRYAVPRELGVVAYPQSVFIYRTTDLLSCKHYFGHLEARTESRFDPVTGRLISRLFTTSEREITVPCLDVKTTIDVVPADSCGAPSKQQVIVSLTPSSLDGSQLKLLTLSRTLPGGVEDVVFNVNKPATGFRYQFTLDTSRLPEGPYPFIATIINVNDQVKRQSVPILVDHTPPALRITYPIQGQKVCGVPRRGPDGNLHNVMTVEGDVSDTGGFHYKLESGAGSAPDAFTEIHDSRRYNDYTNDNPLKSLKPNFHLNNVTGPIAELQDLNGEFTAHLRTFDRGGFEMCVDRTFSFDGLVEGAQATIDRALFSPNGDGVLDEVMIAYGVDESATIDIDIYPAVRTNFGGFTITGTSVRKLLNQASTLAGESSIAWDGRNSAGSVVADGWYEIVVTLKDGCGNLKTFRLHTEVDSTPPAVTIAYPKTNDPLSMVVEIQGAVNDVHLRNYTVEYGVGSSPDAWVALGNKTGNTVDVKELAPWNTYGLSGDYAIRIVATDTVGNQQIVQVPVNIALRTNLISYLEAAPDLISPNGDGKRESTAIRIGFEENVLATLSILDRNAVVKRVLAVNQTLNKGPVSINWDGRDDKGNVLPDDTYTVGLLAVLASNPLVKQDEKVTVVLDQTPPVVDISRPANGFASASGGVAGTIQDAHLAEYNITLTGPTGSEILDNGTNNRVNAVLGSLQGRAEGEYTLKVDAQDQGEIVTSKTISFVIDNTPPKANITTPVKGSVVGKMSPINVAGTLEEKYLATYKLNVGNGETPVAWSELAAGTTLPLPSVLKVWDVSTLNDGVYTLQLSAQDKAGNSGEGRVTVIVDNTPPTVALTSPAEGAYVTKAMDIKGTANDANFAEYRLAVAPGDKATASRWSEIGAGTQPVNAGVLLSWQALPPDGIYALRLAAKDKASNAAETVVQVVVDTQPPAAPVNLKATLESNAARLTWTANSEPDLAGYAVYRNGVRITPALITDPTYLDRTILDGRYIYSVTAFDKAGWESAKSNEATLVADMTAPATRLLSPNNGSTVSGLVDVKGTAYSVDDFKEYRLYVGAGATPTDFQLLRRSPVPVLADLLAQWNTVVLAEGSVFTLKLESEDINGNIGTDTATVTIDNLPPAAPTGLTATATEANVQLAWNANSEPDLYGYLVFRNDRLANVSGVLVGSMKPYAVVPRNYADLSLPDGPYTYYIIAIDKAGNISNPSNTATVSIDTHPPHAVINPPVTNTKFDKPLFVLATTPDIDIAKVQFQYRAAGATAWINLGNAKTTPPYEASFDPAALGLAFGNYQLQAVATDLANKVDPSPTPVTVTYTDVSPPATVLGVSNRVNGGDVTLTWTANAPTGLAGYHVARVDAQGASVRVTATPINATTYVDRGVADGTYRYNVTAVDTNANESVPSAATEAIVYTPVVAQPYSPTRETKMTLTGTGRGSSTLSGELTNTNGTTALPTVVTDGDGLFSLPNLALALGENVATLRLTDAAGNVSKSASITVVSGTAPSKPTGLTATASGQNVALLWNANPESNILGYRIFRDGQALLANESITGLTATASTEWSSASEAVDSVPYTYWSPITSNDQPAAGQWLAVAWSAPKIVTQVTLAWGYEEARAVDFDLEAWSGSAWMTVAQVRGNTFVQHAVNLAQPYRTTQLRLKLLKIGNPDSAYQAVQLSEIGVYAMSLANSNHFTDAASDGNHKYEVSALNVYAFESVPSDPASVPVGNVTPPAAVTLNASVNGANVTLNWTASTSSNVDHYVVYRDGALIATQDDLASLQYIDAGRPNGAYLYVVKAVSIAGIESAASNEALATVAVVVPIVPLVVDLHYPSRPGQLYTATDAFTTIVAHTQGNALVTLMRNGVSVGQGQALAAHETKMFTPASAYNNRFKPSPNGRYVVYQNNNGEVRVYDFADGSDVQIAQVPRFDTAQPFWSADGREILYVNSSDTQYVRAYRLSDGSNRSLTGLNDGNSAIRTAVVSPDGKQFAVIGLHSGQTGIWKIDLANGAWIQVASGYEGEFDRDSLSWSPDSTRLAYLRTSPQLAVEAAHLPSGHVQVIDSQAGLSMPAWSPDGSALIFASMRDGSSQIWRYGLTDNSSAALTQGPDDNTGPAWSPDGRGIAYLANNTLTIRDLASGETTPIVTATQGVEPTSLKWNASGYLSLWTDNHWSRIAPAGRVEFKGVSLAPGDNVFNATAVNAAGTVSAPSDAIVINYATSGRADLVVADNDLQILPAAPLLGESSRVSLTVHNVGAVSSGLANLSLVAIDPQGATTTLLDGSVLNAIAPGDIQILTTDWTPVGGAGSYTLVAIVDPFSELPEVSKANNLAVRTVQVAVTAGQQIAVTTDKPLYVPGETIMSPVNVRNYGQTFSGRLVVSIEDQQGYIVQTVLSKDVAVLAYGQTQSENISWPTGSTFAGAYQVHARLLDSSNQVAAEAIATFNLSAASQLSAQVTTDRGVYVANSNVHAAGNYLYVNGNTTVTGAEAQLRILDSAGVVLTESRQPLGDLLPGTSGTLTLDWNTGLRPVGQYHANLIITKDGATLASSDATFGVEAGTVQLTGALQLSDQAPAPGTPQTVTFTVTNQSNVGFMQLPIIISLVDTNPAAPLDVRRQPTDLAVGENATGSVTFDTAALRLGNYTVALQAEVPTDKGPTVVTLQTVSFSVVDRTPPMVNVRQPSNNGFIRGDAMATVFALDQLSLVKQVEVSVDGSPWVAVSINNAAESLYGDLLHGLSEGTHNVMARATDAWGNTGVTNAVSFIVDNTPPQITIQGVSEGGVYQTDVVPQISFSDAHLDSTTLTLNGLPYISGTPITADGTYRLVATASDKADNRAHAELQFTLGRSTSNPAQLAGEMATRGGVLVWLPGNADTQLCRLQGYDGTRSSSSILPTDNDRYATLMALLENTLLRERSDYLIVRNECSFVQALRSRRYSTLILGELHGVTAGQADDDSSLHMTGAAALEIQATVASGAGILWIKTHPDANERLDRLFGVNFQEAVFNISQVTLSDSPASVAGVWPAAGFGIGTTMNGGTPVGTTSTGGYPAMVLHGYGIGRTALLAFDPSTFTDFQGSVDTLASAIRYAAPVDNAPMAGAVRAMRWTASQLTPPLGVTLKAHLPDGMTFVDTPQGVIVSGREAFWERDLTADSALFNAFVTLPLAKGDYTIGGDLYKKQDASLNLLTQSTSAFSLLDDRDTLGVKTLNLLSGLQVASEQQALLQQVIQNVQSASAHAQQNRDDAAYSIDKLSEASGLLSGINGVSDQATLSLGQLLGTYQTLWSSRPASPSGVCDGSMVTHSWPMAVASSSVNNGTSPLMVTFSGQASTDTDGRIVSYEWDFGDDSTGQGATPSHTYTSPGSYTVRLTVSDDFGLSGSTTIHILVREPTALVYYGPTQAGFNDSVNVSATLTSTLTNRPIPNANITFNVGGNGGSCAAISNASGAATCSLVPNVPAGATTVTTQFLQTDQYAAAQVVVPFNVVLKETKLALSAPASVTQGVSVTLSSTFSEVSSIPVQGRSIAFTLGSGSNMQTCAKASDASGAASCAVSPPLLGLVPINANFVSDGYYKDASATSCTFVHSLNSLSAPAGVTARVSRGSIRIAWNAVQSSNIGTYFIYRYTDQLCNAVKIGQTTGTPPAAAFTDTNVVAGTTYRYWVTTVDKTGNQSDMSSVVSAIAQ